MSQQTQAQKHYAAVQLIRQLCSQSAEMDKVMSTGVYKTLIEIIVSSTVDPKTLKSALQCYYMLSNNIQHRHLLFANSTLNLRLVDISDENSDIKIQQLAQHLLLRYKEHLAEQQQNTKENTVPTSHRQSMKSTEINKQTKNRLTRIPLKINGVTTVQQQKSLELQLVKIAGVVSVTVSGILPNIDFIVYTTAEESEILNDIMENINNTPNQSYRAEKTADKTANRFSVRNNTNVNTNTPQHHGAVAAYTDLSSSTTSQRSIAERRKLHEQQQSTNKVGSVLKSVTSYFW